MQNTIIIQLYSFFIYLITGIIIGIFFDIFRVLRKSFKTPDFVTYIEDMLFWIFTGILLIFVLINFSSGEIRFYNVISLCIGTAIYILLISKYFIRINTTIIKYIKFVFHKIYKIISYPIKLILKFLIKIFKPFIFCIINLKKITFKINIKKNK